LASTSTTIGHGSASTSSPMRGPMMSPNRNDDRSNGLSTTASTPSRITSASATIAYAVSMFGARRE
jgi:hypothetical protein